MRCCHREVKRVGHEDIRSAPRMTDPDTLSCIPQSALTSHLRRNEDVDTQGLTTRAHSNERVLEAATSTSFRHKAALPPRSDFPMPRIKGCRHPSVGRSRTLRRKSISFTSSRLMLPRSRSLPACRAACLGPVARSGEPLTTKRTSATSLSRTRFQPGGRSVLTRRPSAQTQAPASPQERLQSRDDLGRYLVGWADLMIRNAVVFSHEISRLSPRFTISSRVNFRNRPSSPPSFRLLFAQRNRFRTPSRTPQVRPRKRRSRPKLGMFARMSKNHTALVLSLSLTPRVKKSTFRLHALRVEMPVGSRRIVCRSPLVHRGQRGPSGQRLPSNNTCVGNTTRPPTAGFEPR